ncbi:hypothetical protein [Burkholderia anthina]|uniref:hypothetical protein n=1 Tax=Burkholderia anthina TaxID=179879 RepID=UPI00384DDA9F
MPIFFAPWLNFPFGSDIGARVADVLVLREVGRPANRGRLRDIAWRGHEQAPQRRYRADALAAPTKSGKRSLSCWATAS